MRQLADILIEKIAAVGGKAALGRMLGGLTGQAILNYTEGGMPSLTFAIHWKRAFNENLIDLMFADENPMVVAEPTVKYNDKEVLVVQRQLIDCLAARVEMQRELSELKNFVAGTENKPKLKK